MSASPPPTPPPRAPTNDEWRFESITSPCECIEDYRPGGYHPVHLGDVFHDGQYKIIRKLGDGAYSTVWLARDMRYVPAPLLDIKAIDYDRSFVPRNNRYVALKILVSELSGPARELQILEHLDAASPTESSQYVTQLLSTFELQGPNGTHKCLVFEPMGPSVNSMVEELPQFNPRRWEMKVRYPPQMAKSILKQSLQALAFLHENGVAHGDFQPGNMLFTLDDIDSKPEEVLRQQEDVDSGSISPPVQRLDGKQDKWAPRYLSVAQPLVAFTRYSEGFKIKLSDMGGG